MAVVKEPVMERNMSQLREGSLSLNLGSPGNHDEMAVSSRGSVEVYTHHSKGWILDRFRAKRRAGLLGSFSIPRLWLFSHFLKLPKLMVRKDLKFNSTTI